MPRRGRGRSGCAMRRPSPRRKMCAARSSRFPLPSPAQWSLTSSPSCRRTPWRACSRKDLFELLKGLKPGFLRFPGGCIIEGQHAREPLPAGRRASAARSTAAATSIAGPCMRRTPKTASHTCYSHYNQTLGLGYYEYFLLCEKIGAKAAACAERRPGLPVPVL